MVMVLTRANSESYLKFSSISPSFKSANIIVVSSLVNVNTHTAHTYLDS